MTTAQTGTSFFDIIVVAFFVQWFSICRALLNKENQTKHGISIVKLKAVKTENNQPLPAR